MLRHVEWLSQGKDMAVGIEKVLFPEEQLNNHAFTDDDRALLRSYEDLITGLANLFGKYCEVELHSLENPHESVIKIVNGFNKMRTLRAPITNLALRMLKDVKHMGQDHTQSYFVRSQTGALMKSNIIAIRNGKKQVVGFICIKFHIDAPFHEFVAEFFPPAQQVGNPSPGTLTNSVKELVDQAVNNTIDEINRDQTVASTARNRIIVTTLFDRGIFDFKYALNLVADTLNISNHTIYLHIRRYKESKGENE